MSAGAQDRRDERIGVGEKLGYGIGDLPSGLYLNFLGAYLLYFFVDLGGVAPAAMSLMLLISRGIDAITDPLMGILADRTRTRWGRYRPYILFAAVPYGVTGFLIFATPWLVPDISSGQLLVWSYITYGLTMLAFTAVNVPYSGLLGVIHPSSEVRTGVTAYRMFFSGASGIVVGAIATTLVRVLGDGDEAFGIMSTMGVLAAISVLCFLVTFATTQERIPPAPNNSAIKRDLKTLVTTPAWIAVAVSAIFGVIAISGRMGAAKFYFKYVAGDDGLPVFLFFDRFGLWMTALALGQISGVILGFLMQRRFEKSHTIIAGGLVKVAAIATFSMMPLDAIWPQTIAQYFVGLGFGVLMVLAFSMFTDIAEYIDWKSGQQMTALVLSASIFAVKIGMTFGSAMPGFVLGLTGFVPGVEPGTEAISGINFAFATLPILVLLPAGLAMALYPLRHRSMVEIEDDLAARRVQAQ